MRKFVVLAASGLSPPSRSRGCGKRGYDRARPDEFAVARQAPLVIPPDFALVPPQPGAPRPQGQNAQEQALDALFGGAARSAARRKRRRCAPRARRRRHGHALGRRRSRDRRRRQGHDDARHRRRAARATGRDAHARPAPRRPNVDTELICGNKKGRRERPSAALFHAGPIRTRSRRSRARSRRGRACSAKCRARSRR